MRSPPHRILMQDCEETAYADDEVKCVVGNRAFSGVDWRRAT